MRSTIPVVLHLNCDRDLSVINRMDDLYWEGKFDDDWRNNYQELIEYYRARKQVYFARLGNRDHTAGYLKRGKRRLAKYANSRLQISHLEAMHKER